MEERGDVYLDSSRTHADHDTWLAESGASFHIVSTMIFIARFRGLSKVFKVITVSTRSHSWIAAGVSLIPISFICHNDKLGWSNGHRPRRISF
jgi:hypothetical protein